MRMMGLVSLWRACDQNVTDAVFNIIKSIYTDVQVQPQFPGKHEARFLLLTNFGIFHKSGLTNATRN